MLKLLKYDLLAGAKVFLIIYAILLAAACGCGLAVSAVQQPHETSVALMAGVSVMLLVVACIVVFVMTIVMIVKRFNNNLLKGEGYLMNTLPVSKSQLVLSKAFVALLEILVTAGIYWIAAVIFSNLSGMTKAYNSSTIRLIRLVFEGVIVEIMNAEGIYSTVAISQILTVYGISLLVGMFGVVMSIYASLSVGQLVNKYRGLLGLGVFIVLVVIDNYLGKGISALLDLIVKIPAGDMGLTYLWSGVAGIIQSVLFAAGCFVLTVMLLKNRLNIE